VNRSRKAIHAALLGTALVANEVWANPALASAPAVGAGELAKVAGGLVLVLALIAGLGWAAQRMRQGRGTGARHLRILDALPLGTRERLMLVEVDGERVLIGIAGGRIERLHALAPKAADFNEALAAASGAHAAQALAADAAP